MDLPPYHTHSHSHPQTARLDQEINGPNVDAPLRPTVTHLQTDLTDLQTTVRSIREEVDVVYDKFQHLDGVVTTIEGNVTEVEGSVNKAKGRVEEVDGRVTAVETSAITNVEHLRTELETARTQLAILANDVTAPTGRVATLTARLDAMTTELGTTKTTFAQQMDALNGTTTQLLQKLETDTLRKFEDVNSAHAQAVAQLESMDGLVQTLVRDNAALKQLVDDNRMQEAQNRAALEQSLHALIASVQAELEQDRTTTRAMVGDVGKTNDSLERIDQDVQGLRLLDRERNRQLVELAALPQLLSSMQAEVDSLKEGQARGVVSTDVTQARDGNLQAELAKLSREMDGLRQLDQSRAQEMAAMAAMREELASTRAELEDIKSRDAEGRSTAAPASRGIDLNAEISRVQEKTKQLRSSPPSSGTRAIAEPEESALPVGQGAAIDAGDEPGEIVTSAADTMENDPNDPNDQINAALDGLRRLQASLSQDAAPTSTSAADRLNARNAARSGGSVPSSAQTSPVVAERKTASVSESYQPQEKSPKAIESAPQDNNAREEVSLLRQAREEINASVATLQMGSAHDSANEASPPGSPNRDIGAAGHTPAPAGRPLSSADPIMDAARRRMRDDDSPMASGPPASFAPDPSAPNVSRGGALPSQATRDAAIGAPTPARHTGVQLDYENVGGDGDRGMDPPDEASSARMPGAQRYNDPPEDEDSSLVKQVPYYKKVPPVAQEETETSTAHPRTDAIETNEVTERKGVILIQKTTDERKKYQYYDPVQDKQQVVEQQSTSVEREITETTQVVAAQITSEPPAVENEKERGLDASAEAPPSPPARAANDDSPESSPDTSKWSIKTAGELIEQRRMQRMLAGRATMEAAAKSNPPQPPPDVVENNISPRSAAPFSRTNPTARDEQDPQQSIRQQQMRKARQSQGRQSSAAAPSRHRSIVEEAIQFARASRGSPAAPSKDMATSPKDFLSKQNKGTQQRRRQQQRMEKDFGPSPTNARGSTEMSSPRMDSEQSMVVTPDEKSPASANNMSDDLANGIQLEPSPMATRSPDDFENLRRATSSGPSAISPINVQQPAPAQVVQPPASTGVQSDGPTPGCYLVYFADSGGKLVLHYSKTPVDNAIGFWRAGQGKSIQGFKYRQNSGRVELIKGIAGGDANKRKFFSGWCQFIKAAAAFNGSVRKFPNVGGLEIELYAVSKDGTVHFLDVDNEEVDVSQFDAIACLPKNNNLFQGVHNLDVNRFVNTANIAGAALPL